MRTTLTGLGLLLGACAHRPPLVYPSAPLAAKGFDAAIIKRELRLEAFGAELLSHYSQRLLVLTPRGRARARVEIPLDPGESLAALEAVSFGERGEPRYLEDLDVLRAAGGVVFDVPGVETGHAIEYAYTIRGPLRSRRFRFDSDVPVVESALEIDAALAGVSLDAHGPRAPEPAGRRFVQLGLDPGAPSWIDVGFADAAEIQRAPAPLAPMAPPRPPTPSPGGPSSRAASTSRRASPCPPTDTRRRCAAGTTRSRR